jgi:hypothetical protein
MLKHIRMIPLIAGIVIGIIAFLFVKPQQNVVYKYPTPESAGKVVYKDKNGICYQYKADVVDCDKNESRMKEFPLST